MPTPNELKVLLEKLAGTITDRRNRKAHSLRSLPYLSTVHNFIKKTYIYSE